MTETTAAGSRRRTTRRPSMGRAAVRPLRPFPAIVADGLGAHGEEALRCAPPRPGERALDIGCGFGDTTLRLAELVGADGEAVGVDAAPRFIETRSREAAEAGRRERPLPRRRRRDGRRSTSGFDLAFSRMGTMFFANPVAALRNVRARARARRGSRWSCGAAKLDNDWLYRAQHDRRAVSSSSPRSTTSRPAAPGPSRWPTPTRRASILLSAGFERGLAAALRHADPDRRRSRRGGRVRR